MALTGVKISKNLNLELGYIKQTVVQGRRINNNTIIQNNDGFTLAGILNL